MGTLLHKIKNMCVYTCMCVCVCVCVCVFMCACVMGMGMLEGKCAYIWWRYGCVHIHVKKIIATIYLSVVGNFTVTYMCFVQNIFRGGEGVGIQDNNLFVCGKYTKCPNAISGWLTQCKQCYFHI